MNCEQVRESFADYLAGNLEEGLKPEIESHLAGCVSCREETGSLQSLWGKLLLLPDEQPTQASAARFQAMLDAYRQGLKLAEREAPSRAALAAWFGRLRPRQPALQFGLAILLFAMGLWLGPTLSPWRERNRSGGGAADPALAQLREEVSSMKRLVLLSLLEQQSASERLRGVAWAHQIAQPGGQVLSALLHSLDFDPNVNVRLAAVDALRGFASEAVVRKGLLQSLADQTSPLVQIELINLMVDLNARDSIPRLKELLQRPELNPAVRERVQWGLQNLG